jgi:hypothetical protein
MGIGDQAFTSSLVVIERFSDSDRSAAPFSGLWIVQRSTVSCTTVGPEYVNSASPKSCRRVLKPATAAGLNPGRGWGVAMACRR